MWNEAASRAGLADKDYDPAAEAYDDREAVSVVLAVSALTDTSEPRILEDFGEFIAPDLLGLYRSRIDPSWRTFDLFTNVEDTIHTAVGLTDQGAESTGFTLKRVGPNELRFEYDSPRRMAPWRRVSCEASPSTTGSRWTSRSVAPPQALSRCGSRSAEAPRCP